MFYKRGHNVLDNMKRVSASEPTALSKLRGCRKAASDV